MKNESLADYLTQLGSKTSTPGGGAVAAISGAQMAALIKMVAEFSRFEDAILLEQRTALINRSEQAISDFLEFAKQDAVGFEAVMSAYRLPKVSANEKQKQKLALQAALKLAIKAPLDTLNLTVSFAPDMAFLARHGNKNLITDTGIAAALGNTTIIAAEMNVRINLNSLDDQAFKDSIEIQITQSQKAALEMLKVANVIISALGR